MSTIKVKVGLLKQYIHEAISLKKTTGPVVQGSEPDESGTYGVQTSSGQELTLWYEAGEGWISLPSGEEVVQFRNLGNSGKLDAVGSKYRNNWVMNNGR